MKHGSLFSGIGGFDLAAQWMGWENVFHCEYNPFGQRVLKYYWPDAISYKDVTETDFTRHAGQIDILTGGFPCQPYSTAGKRKGKEDDRHLWPEMLRAIREISPRYVVGENVRGLLSWNGGLVFDEVQSDLESEGYDVLPFLLPAASINAPHERYRIWFIAFNPKCAADVRSNAGESSGFGLEMERRELVQARREQGTNNAEPSSSNASNTSIENDRRSIREKGGGQEPQPRGGAIKNVITNTGNGIHAGELANRRDTTAPARSEREHQQQNGRNKDGQRLRVKSCASGQDAANTTSCGRLQNHSCAISEQLTQRIPDWRAFPTQSPLCDGDDGLPTELDGITISKHRRETIKAGGNAIVPGLAYQIFKAIEETELIISI